MQDNHTAALYEGWVQSVRNLTQDQQAALDYREMRSSVAAAIATAILRAAIGASQSPDSEGTQTQPVVYGVWLAGHAPEAPVYIGQTTDSGRRLWDLPVGESHHLANTFPPEIWSHVVVVRWPEVLESYGGDLGIQPIDFGTVGLALEYALQCEFSPLMNVWRKNRDGRLVPARLNASRSVGAGIASTKEFQGFFEQFVTVWREWIDCDSRSAEWEAGDYGGVAFPSRVYRRVLTERGFEKS